MLQLELKIEKFFENPRKIRKKTQFFYFRAEIFFPSWKKKATSRAELGIFDFRAETELDFFYCIAFLAQNTYFSLAFTNFWTRKSVILSKKVSYATIRTKNREVFWKSKENKEKNTIFQFSSWNFFSELKEKGHEPSRAKLKILQLELWLKPARLGLITSVYS